METKNKENKANQEEAYQLQAPNLIQLNDYLWHINKNPISVALHEEFQTKQK